MTSMKEFVEDRLDRTLENIANDIKRADMNRLWIDYEDLRKQKNTAYKYISMDMQEVIDVYDRALWYVLKNIN